MIVQCAKCGKYLDDEFRSTQCPHGAFSANDGFNNFQVHHQAYLSRERPYTDQPIMKINEDV